MNTIQIGAVAILSATVGVRSESPPAPRFTDVGQAIGGKAAFGDYDQDGFVDLFSGNVVYRNEEGRQFVAVASLEGAGGGLWGDFDNDGDLDLYTSAYRLFRNDGGQFVDMTEALPKLPDIHSQGAVWGDFNGDGYLDLYVGSYESWPSAYYADALLISDQGKSFAMTWRQGVDTVVTPGRPRPARGVTAADFDEDGDVDIYVSNYRLEPNALWLNDGSGGITDVGAERNVAGTPGHSFPYGHTIGSAWGDMDNDGHLDLFVGNFRHNWGDGTQDFARFMRNRGPESNFDFEVAAQLEGADWQESYASPALGDYDNDGDLDLFFTTVYAGDQPRLYRNDGAWKFTDVSAEAGLAALGATYLAAWADIDNDGDLDLATAGKIFRNNNNNNNGPAGNWLKVRLEGDGKKVNRAAIAAQVRIVIGDRTLTRQVEGATGEGNQNDLTLHFGLGDYTDAVEVTVAWPDGARSQRTVQPDQTVTIKYDTAAVVP